MSELVEDTDEVVAAAIEAGAAGRFFGTPGKWHAAVTWRVEGRVHGARPTLPALHAMGTAARPPSGLTLRAAGTVS